MSYEPWHPMINPVDLKTLGKFVEECGEGVQAAGRCIIQGMNETNLKEGKSNRLCLQDEIADILCNARLVIERFALDETEIALRIADKRPKLIAWHGMA
jgi:hypothetical protein